MGLGKIGRADRHHPFHHQQRRVGAKAVLRAEQDGDVVGLQPAGIGVLRGDHLDVDARIGLAEAIDVGAKLLEGRVRGRVVVDVNR